MTTRPPKSETGSSSVRPMSAFGAFGWTFATLLVKDLLLVLAFLARESAKHDLVTLVFAQLVSTLLVLYFVLRVYAPEVSVRRFIAFRPTAVAFYPIAIVLGVGLSFSTDKLYELILIRFPPSQDHSVSLLLQSASPLRRIVNGVMVGLVGPIVEETFFRGALFVPLRRFAERTTLLAPTLPSAPDDGPSSAQSPAPPRSRVRSLIGAAIATAVLFTLTHGEWQMFPPILLVGLLLGGLRAASGSMVPTVILHVVYNTTSVLMTFLAADMDVIPASWALGGAALALVGGALAYLVAKTERAAVARADEL